MLNEGLVVVVRAVIGFFSLLIFARVLGKQQIKQLTFFDYVLGITIGSTASTLTTDLSSSAWPHWVGLISWVILGYVMEKVTMKWADAAKYIDGQPAIVIVKGKILERSLKKMKYRVADVMQLLRNKDIFDINQIEFAILEPNGEISILKKSEYQTLTVKDINRTASEVDVAIYIIYDGMVIEENLKYLNKDIGWLKDELKKQEINNISEVFFATLDHLGNIYIDKYDDHIYEMTNGKGYKGPC